ncbi:hypothetical protein FTX61_11085 [Nitriliruptoraceae bacterium ZYF776]|nr:hypothetical protein [Profundirhabdus halotolerans]
MVTGRRAGPYGRGPIARPEVHLVAVSHLVAAALGAGAAVSLDRLRRSGVTSTATLAGSTVAAPTAAAWVTDFLNAAYFAKDRPARDLDDLRLAFTILTTYWNERGTRRLGAADVVRFHRAFGTARLRGAGGRTGTLDRGALFAGGAELFGDWFPAAARDWDRLGWGIAFRTPEQKAAHDPEIRLRQAQVGPLTPPQRPAAEQTWHTYPPVPVDDVDATVAALLAVEHWPDYASELGRFTPLRRTGLDGQTFEIEVVGFPSPRTPIFLRAYVTVHDLVTADDPAALRAWIEDLRSGFHDRPDELDPVPDGAEVHAAFDLVCHQGHFMGDAKNRLVLYSIDGRAFVRAAGTWDPMSWHLAEVYDRVGRWSQHAFWGMEEPEQSMLHQLAVQAGRRLAVGGAA